MDDWKAKEAARAAAAKALQAANPHLIPKNGDGLVTAAKNVRIELKRAFPGVKFSVKTRRFSGGDAMDVRWTDGPVTKQVDAIVGKYAAGSFNGMDDSYTYVRDTWTDAFGDAKYVHTTRDNSDRAIESAMRTILAKHGEQLGELAKVLTLKSYKDGTLWRTVAPNWLGYRENLWDVVSIVVQERTWAIDKTPKAVPMAEPAEVA